MMEALEVDSQQFRVKSGIVVAGDLFSTDRFVPRKDAWVTVMFLFGTRETVVLPEVTRRRFHAAVRGKVLALPIWVNVVNLRNPACLA